MSSYLPGVEAGAKPGTYASLIDAAKRDGREYSKIWDLFAFAPDTMHHLSHLTQGIMRQPASISDGHARADRRLHLAPERLPVLHDGARRRGRASCSAARRWSGPRCATSSARALDDKHKALLRFVGKVTRDLPAVWRDDVATLRGARLGRRSDLLRHLASAPSSTSTTAGSPPPASPRCRDEAHRQQGKNLARGYVRD